MKHKLSNILQLTRFGLSMAIGFSAVAGQLLASHGLNLITFYTFLGVVLLSGAASALNQFQERDLDAKMGRTRNRPLPAGYINPASAILLSIVLGLSGASLLFFGTTWMATCLGIFNLVWYNLVYTPLKQKSPFALLIGAVTGAIPPMIGWCAAGGSITDSTILAVACFMFLWQIPHFWLILLKYGKEYEAAGFGPLSAITFGSNIKSILFIWVVGTSISTLLFPYFHIVSSLFLVVILLGVNAFLIYFFYRFLFSPKQTIHLRSAFGTIYLYQLLVLVVLIISSVFL